MILTAIKIGGVDFLARTLLRGFTVTDSSGDRMGTCSMTVFGTPADLAATLTPGAEVEVDAGSVEVGIGNAAEFGGVMYGEAVFGDPGTVSSPQRIFYGRVITVAPVPDTVGSANDGLTEYTLTCRNYGDLLNSTIVSTAKTYTSQTDKAIILDLFATYLPEISTAGVASTTAIDSITFDNISLRQALENLVAQTGAEFYVDVLKTLQYHQPVASAAPFGFSETPDNVSTFLSLSKPTYLWDFSQGANRIVVLGAVGAGGVVTKATRNHGASQAAYGVLSKVVVDRSIATQAQADTTGDVQLAKFANPIQSGTVSTNKDGLTIGMYLPLTLPAINVSGSFVVKKVTMTWPSSSVTHYAVEWGDYLPDLARLLRKLATYAPQSPQTPTSTPGPGTVTPGSFASTIQPVYIVASLPGLPNTNYPSDTVVILTTDHKLYRNAAGMWVKATDVADLSGQIITTQITDLAITSPKIGALAIIAGKIDADAVTAGCIAAGAIRASDAAFDTGAIQTADIANLAVTAAKIANATITNAQIANATIDHAKIASVDADTITVGTLSGARLADGSIGNVKIASGLDATKITTGALNADLITTGTLSANRISAGTISGNIVIGGGGSLTVSGGSVSITGGLTVTALCSFTVGCSGASFGVNAANHFDSGGANMSNYAVNSQTVIDSSRVGYFSAIASGGYTVADSGGQLYAQSAIQVGGGTVVKGQQSGPGTPSFASLADAQSWCAALNTALKTHGLIS